ncbi:glycine cleavage system protein GcvH [Cellulomonas hominis]|uniref:glycine cleavage system protein GcvH n=1 Tax=Cellulomonas hominis TaxID=156981 RepID=UPI001B9FEFF7|nr:glycine cleavage system protein GcvH [Cellulomonas hominis]VTR76405.1 Glycine cleavage system H protein [Cellulomonas hominis]
MSDVPSHLQYTAEHEWIEGETPATVGITKNAADSLGDIVYLELPTVGSEIAAGAVVGEVESTKSVSELFSPVSGTVVEVNQEAVDEPSVVNADPYGAGWLFRVDVTGTGALLSAEEYAAQITD